MFTAHGFTSIYGIDTTQYFFLIDWVIDEYCRHFGAINDIDNLPTYL